MTLDDMRYNLKKIEEGLCLVLTFINEGAFNQAREEVININQKYYVQNLSYDILYISDIVLGKEKRKMEKNDKVKYVGKGFLGYKADVDMFFIRKESLNSVWVRYGECEMIVSPYEIKEANNESRDLHEKGL